MPDTLSRLRFVLVMIGIGALSGCSVFSDRHLLWQIVHDRCVPNQIAQGKPDPCTLVSIPTGVDRGYVVLKDRNGIGQYLVMPTTLVTGIEDAKLRSRHSPDYFTPAWQAKRLVEERLGMSLAREDVGVAVNSFYGRSQDLLHLHVDCLRDDVRGRLHQLLPEIGYQWSLLPLPLAGHAFHAVRIDGDDVVATNPVLRLSEGLNIRPEEMASWTIVLAGADFPDGKPGFVLLAARANLLAGYYASGETLQDHDCRIRNTRLQ